MVSTGTSTRDGRSVMDDIKLELVSYTVLEWVSNKHIDSVRPRNKLFVSWNGPKNNWVGRSVRKEELVKKVFYACFTLIGS